MHCARSSLALRVARRHLADSPYAQDRGLTILVSDAGVVTSADVARLLLDGVGRLKNVPFGEPDPNDPDTVPWDAVTEAGDTVSGHLLPHAGTNKNYVACWPRSRSA